MRIIFLLVFLVNFIFGSVAIVSAFKGEANVIRGGKNLDVKIGFKLEEGDVLLSKDKTKIQLIFNDKTIITIGKNSKFSINEYIYDETKPKEVNAKFGFAKGMFRTITGKIGKINPNRFKIKAHSATIGIRGTKFDVVVNDFQTKIGVIKGGVYFLQNNQITDILSGEMMIYTIDTGNMEIKDGILIETQEFYDKNDKVKERINSVKKVFNSKIKILKDKILKDRVNITIDPIVDNLKIEVVKLFQNSLDDTTDNILDDENYNSIRDEIVDYYNDLPNDDLSTILEQFILTE
ncbi:MAG: FecR domain-containing protein, partial [Arcobacteraceae bacterium]|nr:FecR domain-containing protein [Arcobacteraceae bacterium]